MRCTVCDYSDDTPSILNDGLTDGNLPRTFKEKQGEVLCNVCDTHVKDVAMDWKRQEYDDTGKGTYELLDPEWDGTLD